MFNKDEMTALATVVTHQNFDVAVEKLVYHTKNANKDEKIAVGSISITPDLFVISVPLLFSFFIFSLTFHYYYIMNYDFTSEEEKHESILLIKNFPSPCVRFDKPSVFINTILSVIMPFSIIIYGLFFSYVQIGLYQTIDMGKIGIAPSILFFISCLFFWVVYPSYLREMNYKYKDYEDHKYGDMPDPFEVD